MKRINLFVLAFSIIFLFNLISCNENMTKDEKKLTENSDMSIVIEDNNCRKDFTYPCEMTSSYEVWWNIKNLRGLPFVSFANRYVFEYELANGGQCSWNKESNFMVPTKQYVAGRICDTGEPNSNMQIGMQLKDYSECSTDRYSILNESGLPISQYLPGLLCGWGKYKITLKELSPYILDDLNGIWGWDESFNVSFYIDYRDDRVTAITALPPGDSPQDICFGTDFTQNPSTTSVRGFGAAPCSSYTLSNLMDRTFNAWGNTPRQSSYFQNRDAYLHYNKINRRYSVTDNNDWVNYGFIWYEGTQDPITHEVIWTDSIITNNRYFVCSHSINTHPWIAVKLMSREIVPNDVFTYVIGKREWYELIGNDD